MKVKKIILKEKTKPSNKKIVMQAKFAASAFDIQTFYKKRL